jgi:hypothetical protein
MASFKPRSWFDEDGGLRVSGARQVTTSADMGALLGGVTHSIALLAQLSGDLALWADGDDAWPVLQSRVVKLLHNHREPNGLLPADGSSFFGTHRSHHEIHSPRIPEALGRHGRDYFRAILLGCESVACCKS